MPQREKAAYDRAALRAALRPIRLHYFGRLRSTSDHAAAMRRRRTLFAPAIVVTANQTAGRGRGKNTWWSAGGSLTATLALRADLHLETHHVPLIAGLAVRDALAELAGDDAIGLKWPNDVVYRDRKLAGLLCERIGTIDLIGIGINVRRPPKVPTAIARSGAWLSEITDAANLTEVLVAVARRVRRALERRDELPFAQVLARYRDHHALQGRRITVSGTAGTNGQAAARLSGICQGLDSAGRLLVAPGRGGTAKRVVSGTVRLAKNGR